MDIPKTDLYGRINLRQEKSKENRYTKIEIYQKGDLRNIDLRIYDRYFRKVDLRKGNLRKRDLWIYKQIIYENRDTPKRDLRTEKSTKRGSTVRET